MNHEILKTANLGRFQELSRVEVIRRSGNLNMQPVGFELVGSAKPGHDRVHMQCAGTLGHQHIQRLGYC